MQENLVVVKEERLFLLRKLCQLQGEVESSNVAPKSNSSHSNLAFLNADGSFKKSSKKKYPNTDLSKATKSHLTYKKLHCNTIFYNYYFAGKWKQS